MITSHGIYVQLLETGNELHVETLLRFYNVINSILVFLGLSFHSVDVKHSYIILMNIETLAADHCVIKSRFTAAIFPENNSIPFVLNPFSVV